MNGIRLVMSAAVRNTFRNKIVPIVMAPIMLICVVGVAILFCLLLIGPEMKSASPDRAYIEAGLTLMLYASSLITIGITLNSLVFQTMVREKTRGNLAALMSTPLKLTDIWVGKSLSLFVPGLILGIIITALTWLIINLVYFVPDIGFLFTWEMVVVSLVVVPVVYLFFGLLVHLLGFIMKSGTGNVIAQIFLPVMANIGIQLGVRDVIAPDSWQFLVLHAGLAAIFGVLALIFKPRLTPEQVVLSAG